MTRKKNDLCVIVLESTYLPHQNCVQGVLLFFVLKTFLSIRKENGN